MDIKYKYLYKFTVFILTAVLVVGSAVPAFAVDAAEDTVSADVEQDAAASEDATISDADDDSYVVDDADIFVDGDDDEDDVVADEAANASGTDDAGDGSPTTPEESDPITVDNLPDPEDLIEGYIEQEAEEELDGKSHIKSTRRKYLDGQSAAIYDILKEKIQEIAAGNLKSTIIEVPVEDFMDPVACSASDLGLKSIVDATGSDVSEDAMNAFHSKVLTVNVAAIVRALQADIPYELYWYNKSAEEGGGTATQKPSVVLSGDKVVFDSDAVYRFKFRVSSDYSSDGSNNGYRVDTSKIEATNATAENAARIVEEVSAASGSDYDTLVAYRNRICDLVTYDYDAPGNKQYGNPWQLIWVFDGNPDTNVVCEGYAKAFKFLCDLTDFRSSIIDCRLMTGTIKNGDGKSENHMWNVVRMNDGLNYMVDVTNCDQGTKGYPDKLFLKGDSKRSGTGYTFLSNLVYAYDTVTVNQFSLSERTLAAEDYVSGKADAENFSDAVEHTHYLITDKNAKEPTCTENGKTASKHCSICGEIIVKSEIIPALGHDYGAWVSKDADQHSRVCAHDGSHVETAAHSWDSGEITKEPTCTETGIKTYTCTDCGETKTETVDATGHTFGDWVTTAEPTCTEAGTKERICSVCEHKETEEGAPATGHIFDDWVTTADPTCTEAGTKERTCTVCDHKETEEGEPATGHSFGEWETAAGPTCTEAGTKERVCSVCEHKETEEGEPATGHTFGDWETAADPTCTEAGTKERVCSVCEYKETEEGEPATGHTFGDWETAEYPTCTEAGTKERVCTVCDHKETEEGEPATGHSFDEGEITKEPTCTETGIKTYTCTDCGETKTEPVDATGHDFSEWITTAEPTCTEAGTKERTCTVCDHKETEEGEPATGHSFGEWETTEDPTCTEAGTKERTCTVCDHKETEEGEPATGHSFGAWVSKDATQHSRVCAHDGSHIETAAHSWNSGEITKAATCTETGVKTYTCTVCGETKTETVAATGHKFSAWKVTKAATYDAEGQQQRVCSGCGKTETGVITKLAKTSITKASVSGLKALTYTGNALTQAPVVKVGTKTLKSGTDYTCTYKNNVNAGTATITFTGKGAYNGSLAKTFKINAKSVTPSVTLSASTYTYNGGVKKPAVTVKIGSTKLAASAYTVNYAAGRKNVGKYNVTVKLKGNYAGSKTASFNIIPKGSSVAKLAGVKKGINVTWVRQKTKMSTSVITGYQIQYSTNKKFASGNKTVTVKGYNSATKAIKGLASKKTYYVRIRTYKTVNKVNYYSAWSAAKTVKTK